MKVDSHQFLLILVLLDRREMATHDEVRRLETFPGQNLNFEKYASGEKDYSNHQRTRHCENKEMREYTPYDDENLRAEHYSVEMRFDLHLKQSEYQ